MHPDGAIFCKVQVYGTLPTRGSHFGDGEGDEWISKSVKARLHYRGEGADLSVEYRCKRYGTKHSTVTHLLTYMAKARQTMPARPTPERGQSATHWKPSLSALVGYQNASRLANCC
jgi:hypothetical protein